MRNGRDHTKVIDDVDRTIRQLGGHALTVQLLAAGHSRERLFAAELAGEVIRPRKGHWLNRSTDPEVVRAVRVGGRLSCVSVALRAGLWVPDTGGLHVELPANAARPRSPDRQRLRLAECQSDVVTHWTAAPGSASTAAIAPLSDALRVMTGCLRPEESFAVLESARNRGVMASSDLERLTASLPKARAALGRASDRSESGLESMLRVLLDGAGIEYRQQVSIAEIGRVDFLIGDALIVEVDGRRYHEDFHRDRVRDSAASISGRRTLRFDYRQLRFEPDEVLAAIGAAIRRGDHLLRSAL